jgi:hypothetical protein
MQQGSSISNANFTFRTSVGEPVHEKESSGDELENGSSKRPSLAHTPKFASASDIVNYSFNQGSLVNGASHEVRETLSDDDHPKTKKLRTAEDWDFFTRLEPFIESLKRKRSDLKTTMSTIGNGSPSNIWELTPIFHKLTNLVTCAIKMIKEEKDTLRGNVGKNKLNQFLLMLKELNQPTTRHQLDVNNRKKKKDTKLFWDDLETVCNILGRIQEVRANTLLVLYQRVLIEKISFKINLSELHKIVDLNSTTARQTCIFDRVFIRKGRSKKRIELHSYSISPLQWYDSILMHANGYRRREVGRKALNGNSVDEEHEKKEDKLGQVTAKGKEKTPRKRKGKNRKKMGKVTREEFLDWFKANRPEEGRVIDTNTDYSRVSQESKNSELDELRRMPDSPYYRVLKFLTEQPIRKVIEAIGTIWPFLGKLDENNVKKKSYSYTLHFRPSKLLKKKEAEIHTLRDRCEVIQHQTYAIAVKIFKKKQIEAEADIILVPWKAVFFTKSKKEEVNIRIKAVYKVRNFPRNLKHHIKTLRSLQETALKELRAYQHGEDDLSGNAVARPITKFPSIKDPLQK